MIVKMKSSVPDDHLKEIGRINVNFALLEMSIALGIWMLLGRDKTQDFGKIITSELSFKNLTALFSSLFHYLSEDEALRDELKDLLKKAISAEEKRNIIVHSLFGAGRGNTITRFKTTARVHKGLKNQIDRYTVEDLNKIAVTISDVSAEIQSFLIENIDSKVPSKN